MPNDAALIEMDEVGYRQRGVEILRNVRWRAARGDRWAVLGPNGSGKTTLLRIACGYLWPTSGVVRRLGEELVDLGQLRRSIGWVATDMASQIPPSETAVETVVSGKYAQVGLRRWAGAGPAAEDFAAADELLRQMHCGALAAKRFAVLSQGERQQVLVARARMVDPLLLVLDEPCAGMDPGVRERFLAWLDRVASTLDDCAMVLVTHHVEEIMPAFTRSLIMSEGRITAEGATRDVATSENLQQAYDVPVERLEEAHGRRWPIWGKQP
jgi:iron complex transport system ATP-binding protein